MSVAVHDFGVAPAEFWSMTLSEFDILTGEKVDRLDRQAGRLTRAELAELERVGRKAVERERLAVRGK